MKKLLVSLLFCSLIRLANTSVLYAQETQPAEFVSGWEKGEKVYLYYKNESVPTPEEGDYIRTTSRDRANCVGEIYSVSEEGICEMRIYKLKNDKKSQLIAIRRYDSNNAHRGRQTDFYPSGKVKRIRTYNTSGKLVSFVEQDTLGHLVKKVEGCGGKARKEWQYHTNGQIRKEKIGLGPKYDIHCFDKKGNPVYYYEGDLYVFDDGVYAISGNSPSFPGGIDSVMSYVEKRIKIPQTIPNGLFQTICSIRIDDDGMVSDVTINTSCGYSELDEEIVRVVKNMPKWTPGTLKKWKFVQNPKDAKITIIRKRFTVPITIIL